MIRKGIKDGVYFGFGGGGGGGGVAEVGWEDRDGERAVGEGEEGDGLWFGRHSWELVGRAGL